MNAHADARRRMLAAKGRPMVLRRLTTTTSCVEVTVQGFMRAYRPEQISGDVRQGDAVVAIGADEIAAATWPGPPRARDQMAIDGRVWVVGGVIPVAVGADVIGYDVWVRGGGG